MTDTTPRDIIDAITAGMRRKLVLTETECYPSIAPVYIDGQPPTVYQIVPGPIPTSDGGEGYQYGGALFRAMRVNITVWRRILSDQHGQTETVLLQEAYGMLTIMENIRSIFAMTTLGSIISEPMKFVSESDTSVFDADSGVYRRDIGFTASWGIALPTEATLVQADVLVSN